MTLFICLSAYAALVAVLITMALRSPVFNEANGKFECKNGKEYQEAAIWQKLRKLIGNKQ